MRSLLLAAARGGNESRLLDRDLEGEIPDDYDFEEVLSRFVNSRPKSVLMCSVTDSMVSGSWGLREFRLGGRGFLFYQPDWGVDDGESFPILGAWEPAEDQNARRVCIIRVYLHEWKTRALPPVMGQWARGDPKLLQEAILRVLEAEPNAWEMVVKRLRETPELRDRDVEVTINRVAESYGAEPARLREFLQVAFDLYDRIERNPSSTQQGLPKMDLFHRKLNQDGQPLETCEACHMVVALYVDSIGQGGFRSR